MISGMFSCMVGVVVFFMILWVLVISVLIVFFLILKISLLCICNSIFVGRLVMVVGIWIIVWWMMLVVVF